MNLILTDYEICGSGEQKKIQFDQNSLNNLEDLLNSVLIKTEAIQSYITKLSNILNNWTNLASIVNINYGGFWDSEIKQAFGVQGTWFSFAGYVHFEIYISVENEKIYIENNLIPENQVVELPLNEFVSILKQWKNI